jgi:predicted ArsR family transcriptional regulator
MQATRQSILDFLRRESRATVKDFVDLLGLTATGVRQHLTLLERDGLVEAFEERGRVGRPALIYRLSDRGEALFPRNYDLLANLLLDELRANNSGEGFQESMRRIASRMAAPFLSRVEGKPIKERVAETASIMRGFGCVAEWSQEGDEIFLRQFTCPYPMVARKHSVICALEVAFVRQLAGADARLCSSLLRSDKSCTYRIKPGRINTGVATVESDSIV